MSLLTHLCSTHCHHSHTCVPPTVITHTPASQPLSSLTHLCHNHCPHLHTYITTLSSLTHLCHNHCHHSHTCVTTTVLFQLRNQLNCIMPVFCHKGVTTKGNSHQTSSMPCGSTGEAVSRHTRTHSCLYTCTQA